MKQIGSTYHGVLQISQVSCFFLDRIDENLRVRENCDWIDTLRENKVHGCKHCQGFCQKGRGDKSRSYCMLRSRDPIFNDSSESRFLGWRVPRCICEHRVLSRSSRVWFGSDRRLRGFWDWRSLSHHPFSCVGESLLKDFCWCEASFLKTSWFLESQIDQQIHAAKVPASIPVGGGGNWSFESFLSLHETKRKKEGWLYLLMVLDPIPEPQRDSEREGAWLILLHCISNRV